MFLVSSHCASFSLSPMHRVLRELHANFGVFFLGIVNAAVGTCSGLSVQLLSQRCGGSVPALQSFSSYIFLVLIWVPIALRTFGWRSLFRGPPWFAFPLIAFLDVQANMLIVWAYRYASIRSVSITSSSSVPFVMILSALLGRPPKVTQLLGAAMCLAGVAAYTSQSVSSSGSAELLGCLLALGSALAYALVNVVCEQIMQSKSNSMPISTYMASLSLPAFAISAIQALILMPSESHSLRSAIFHCGGLPTFVLLLAFAAVIFVYYSFAIFLLSYSSAAWFNCSMLSANLFAVAGARVIFGTPLDLFYFFCLALVIAGLVVFYLPSPSCTPSELRASMSTIFARTTS